MSTEAERAAAYRAMMAARAANTAARERALSGRPDSRRALQEAWQPILDPLGDIIGDAATGLDDPPCEDPPWGT